jgi:pyridoxine kinase
MNRVQRVAAIHDLSGFGRCALSVILPTMSAMGIQVVAVPTAVLSTHTGGMGEVVLRDLTDYMEPTLAHYRRLELEFEAIYSGFLASVDQIDHCLSFFDAYPNALTVVDPVMGDHGKLYRTYTREMQRRMGELVAVADLITPNLTEACLLLGDTYNDLPLTRQQARSMLARLTELGPKQAVVTGVPLSGHGSCNIGYDRERSAYWMVEIDYVPVSYPGTGDLYAGVLTGAIMNGDSLPMAMDRATRFTEIAIKTTFSYGTDQRHGVMLERALPYLTSAGTVPEDYQIL